MRTLKVANVGDVTITHHWTGLPLTIHSFHHKGYWFHGRNRERETMIALARLLGPGDTVFDVGGHVGYIAMWASALVGEHGTVVAFEPGANNLPYIRRNLAGLPNCTIVEKALAGTEGSRQFLIEDLTGQNNSLVTDGAVLRANELSSGIAARRTIVDLETTTLDAYVDETVAPTLVKIDVEGAELEVLEGGGRVLERDRPAIVVEVSDRDCAAVQRLLHAAGYVVLGPDLNEVVSTLDVTGAVGQNFVCLHRERHGHVLSRLKPRR